jgi:hypothetical protein
LQERRALRSTFFPSLSFRVFGFSWKLGFGVHQHFCWVLSRSASTRNVVQICKVTCLGLLHTAWTKARSLGNSSGILLLSSSCLRIFCWDTHRHLTSNHEFGSWGFMIKNKPHDLNSVKHCHLESCIDGIGE